MTVSTLTFYCMKVFTWPSVHLIVMIDEMDPCRWARRNKNRRLRASRFINYLCKLVTFSIQIDFTLYFVYRGQI